MTIKILVDMNLSPERGIATTGIARARLVAGTIPKDVIAGLDGVDGPLTASMCHSWVIESPTDGSHP